MSTALGADHTYAANGIVDDREVAFVAVCASSASFKLASNYLKNYPDIILEVPASCLVPVPWPLARSWRAPRTRAGSPGVRQDRGDWPACFPGFVEHVADARRPLGSRRRLQSTSPRSRRIPVMAVQPYMPARRADANGQYNGVAASDQAQAALEESHEEPGGRKEGCRRQLQDKPRARQIRRSRKPCQGDTRLSERNQVRTCWRF